MRPIWSNTTVSMSTHTNWPYLILCMPDYDVDDVHSTLNYTLGEFFLQNAVHDCYRHALEDGKQDWTTRRDEQVMK